MMNDLPMQALYWPVGMGCSCVVFFAVLLLPWLVVTWYLRLQTRQIIDLLDAKELAKEDAELNLAVLWWSWLQRLNGPGAETGAKEFPESTVCWEV